MPCPGKSIKLHQCISSNFGASFIPTGPFDKFQKPARTQNTMYNFKRKVLESVKRNLWQVFEVFWRHFVRLHKTKFGCLFSYYPFCCVFLLPVHQDAVLGGRVPSRQQHLLYRVPVKVKLSLKSNYKFVNSNTIQFKLHKRL